MSTKAGRQRNHGDTDEDAPQLKFPFPPPDFDPLRASPEELAKYGLPRRPDRERQPELLEAWLRLFQPPLIFVPAELETFFPLVQVPRIRQILPNKSRFSESQNWCGASIVPSGGNQFVLMFGEWTVPKPEEPPPAEQGPKGKENQYYCSTWIGFDGNRRYLDSTLPQIGTEQKVTVNDKGKTTSHEYSVWFQWWARNQVKIRRKTLKNITVGEGVSVMAMVWVIDPHHVVMVFRTFAPMNQITILVKRVPQVWLTPAKTAKIRPAISGATAEWILERPETLKPNNAKLELFAKYNPVQFRHCVAGTAPAAGLPTSEETLTGPRFFRLYEVLETPHPFTRLISMPTRISTSSIEIHYGGFPD
jgi:hypothetical protein